MAKKNYRELVDEIKSFCDERDWKQFHDGKNLALSLVLESSEVLELFQWTQNNEVNPDKLNELPDELADVLFCLIKLADKYNINLLDALDNKMQQNREKYPIDKAKGISKKYTEL